MRNYSSASFQRLTLLHKKKDCFEVKDDLDLMGCKLQNPPHKLHTRYFTSANNSLFVFKYDFRCLKNNISQIKISLIYILPSYRLNLEILFKIKSDFSVIIWQSFKLFESLIFLTQKNYVRNWLTPEFRNRLLRLKIHSSEFLL